VARERQFYRRGEDADPGVGIAVGGEHEGGLRQVHLPGDTLHPFGREVVRVGDDRQRVALERGVGEDVGDRIGMHRRKAISLYGWRVNR
jgi:hypothetical protein